MNPIGWKRWISLVFFRPSGISHHPQAPQDLLWPLKTPIPVPAHQDSLGPPAPRTPQPPLSGSSRPLRPLSGPQVHLSLLTPAFHSPHSPQVPSACPQGHLRTLGSFSTLWKSLGLRPCKLPSVPSSESGKQHQQRQDCPLPPKPLGIPSSQSGAPRCPFRPPSPPMSPLAPGATRRPLEVRGSQPSFRWPLSRPQSLRSPRKEPRAAQDTCKPRDAPQVTGAVGQRQARCGPGLTCLGARGPGLHRSQRHRCRRHRHRTPPSYRRAFE